MKKYLGFTLIELLFTLSIVIILISVGSPTLLSLKDAARSRHLYHSVFTLIQYARSQSVVLYKDVIICPSNDDTHCVNNWQLPLILFIDDNRNKRRDVGEKIERKVQLLKSSDRFIWRASATSRYLRFHIGGLTSSQNGTFIICPSSGQTWHIQKIILFYTGRARKAQKKEIKASDCR